MSGIRILLKGGQSVDYRGISLEEFVEEFTIQKGDAFVIGNDKGLQVTLLWSEIIGAIDLDTIDPDSNRFDKWLRENL